MSGPLAPFVTAFEYARLLEWRFEDAHGVRGRERWTLDRVAGPMGADCLRVLPVNSHQPRNMGYFSISI